MQVQLQAFSSKPISLRKAITDDLQRNEHETLVIKELRNKERKSGWSKIGGKNVPGAINFKWDNFNAYVISMGGYAWQQQTSPASWSFS